MWDYGKGAIHGATVGSAGVDNGGVDFRYGLEVTPERFLWPTSNPTGDRIQSAGPLRLAVGDVRMPVQPETLGEVSDCATRNMGDGLDKTHG